MERQLVLEGTNGILMVLGVVKASIFWYGTMNGVSGERRDLI